MPKGVFVLALCLLTASGCGTAPAVPQAVPAVGGHNATDVMFVQMMLPHHEQGIQIVRLAEGRPVRTQVKLLMEAIEVTQQTEIETMSGWLREWGAAASAPAQEHAAHGGVPATDASAIEAVAGAHDSDFERHLLNLLIAHQDDAVQMALREKNGGTHEPARQLADRIDQSRSTQIKMMLEFLRQDP